MTSKYTQQVSFRGRDDDVTLNSTTWTHAELADFSQNVDVTFRIRIQVEETNNKNTVVPGQLIYFLNNTNQGSVTTSSSGVIAVASSFSINDVAVTPAQMTQDTGTSFIGGWGCEDGIPSGIAIQNEWLENEYSVQIVGADVNNGDIIGFAIDGLDAILANTTGSIVVLKSETFNLVMNNIQQDQTSENINLTQHHILEILNSQQDQTPQNIDITYHPPPITLVMNNAEQTQTAENVDVTYNEPHFDALAQNAEQTQSSGDISLIQNYVLNMQNIQQDQTSSNISLTQNYNIISNNASQDQTADNVTVTYHEPHFDALAQNVEQTETSDNITLIQHYLLTANVISQAQSSDNISMSQGLVMVISSPSQGQTTADIVLAQNYIMLMADSSQTQTSSNISFAGTAIVVMATMHYRKLRSR